MADQPIKYDDIISPEVQAQIDELAKTIKELTNELSQLAAETQKEDKAADNYNDTLRDSVDITEDLLRLTKENISLKKKVQQAQDVINDTIAEGVEVTTELTAEQLKNKAAVSAQNFQLKNATKLAIANKTSMTELSLELGKNRMAYRNLTKAERDNTSIGGKLLKTIKTQDAAIKKLDKSIGNTQRNVGNYTKAMGKATVSTKKWGGAIAGIAIGALVSSAKNMQAAADGIEDASNVAVIAVGNLVKAYKGEISLGEALSGQEIWDAAKAMTEVNRQADFLRALTDRDLSTLKFRIEQQKLIQNDTRQDFDTRIKANETLNVLLDAHDIVAKKGFDEQVAQYNVILENDKDNIAAQTSKIELQKKLDDDLRQSAVIRTEIQRSEIVLNEEAIDSQQTLVRVKNDGYIQTMELAGQTFAQQKQLALNIRDTELSLINDRYENAKKYSKDWYTLLTERQITYQEYTAAIAEIDAAQRSAQITGIQSVANSASTILGTMAEDNKDIQIAQAIINTFAAAVQVLNNEPGEYIVKAAAMIATLATGFAQVKQIQNTTIPSYAVGTDELGGDEVAQVHKGERILPSYLNKQIAGVSNIDLPKIVNIGLKMPNLIDGIEDMIQKQSTTNSLLKRFAYVDKSGNIHYLTGDKTIYV